MLCAMFDPVQGWDVVPAPSPGEAEVADLEVAVGVQQQVGGLQIPVQHIRRVDVLQTTQQLRSTRCPSDVCAAIPL